MFLRTLAPLLSVTALLAGCFLLPGAGMPQGSGGYQPAGASTVWPAPGGNLVTCTPSGPGGDTPTPRKPAADSLKVRSRTLQRIAATLCSSPMPAPQVGNGTRTDPLQ